MKMDEKDLDLLWKFTLRIPMYTGIANKDTVSSFIYGYEIGRNFECDFIEKMISSIQDEYKIEKQSTGWMGQIDKLAEKTGIDWVTAFKKQSFKILTKEFDKKMQNEFSDSIKQRISAITSRVEIHFQKSWITIWFGIVDLEADWFQKIWSEKELKLIIEIEEELKTFGNIQEIETEIEPTEKLKSICTELYEEINNKTPK